MALSTMYEGKNNSPVTDITSAISATDQIIPVTDISVFPAAPNLATIGSDENAEVIRYNGIDGNSLTGCERGFGDTEAKAWPSSSVISRQITKYDMDTLRGNVLDLNTRKQNTYSADAAQWDTTPTAGSTKPVTSGGIKSALDDKQDELTFDSTPTASSSNPVTSGGVKTYADNKILYFYEQTTSVTAAATTEFCRITDSRIDANTVVLNLGFTEPSAITSGVSWTSAAGYISFKGICTSSNCKVNAVLGQKGN